MKLNELEDFPELGNTIVIDGIEYVKKREPLSDEEIFNAWIPSKATPCVHSFKAGVKFAEKPLYTSPPKREPLSEEESYHEAKRLYEAEDGLGYADGFVDGLKFAEKMHGIGGGE